MELRQYNHRRYKIEIGYWLHYRAEGRDEAALLEVFYEVVVKVKIKVTSNHILNVLSDRMFSEPAHVWLYEVRNGTGYRGQTRYADALVISAWPSRGIWFAGIEVKVSRADWMNEVRDPNKSSEIQQYCDYWWVAAPVGVVQIGEIPENWGLVEISGKKASVVKQAPKLTPLPLSSTFVASVFRNEAGMLNRIRDGAYRKGYQECEGKHSTEELHKLSVDLLKAKGDATNLKLDNENLRRWHLDLKNAVENFEKKAGFSIRIFDKSWGADAALLGVAEKLRGMNLEYLSSTFDKISEELRKAKELLNGKVL